MSRPAIVWQRVGASGLMFLNAPGVKWAGGESSGGVRVTADVCSAVPGAGRGMANDPMPSALTFPPVPTP